VGANASSNPFSRTLRLVLGNQISIPLCMIEASEVPVWKLHATERDVFYPSPFSLTVLIDGSNPGYIILFCTTSQVYSLECMHNGLTHHTVSEEEKEDPRRGHSPHTSGSPPRNIPLRISRGQLALAKHSHPIELLRFLRKNARTSPDYESRSAYQKSNVSHA